MDEMMDEIFEEMLAICLDRLSGGEDVDSCLADYPDCSDLRPLLEIAAALIAASADHRRRAGRTPVWLMPRRHGDRLRPTG
jgi:hypothetical protein